MTILSERFRVACPLQGLLIFLLFFELAGTDALFAFSSETGSQAQSDSDPYLWLEDVTGQKALDWVRQQNAVSINELEFAPEFEPIRRRLLSILDSKDRIHYVAKHGQWYYNFWRDNKNPRGLWRRTSLSEYKKSQPAWETVLDLDELSANEKENWVWKGYEVLYPTYDRSLLCFRGEAQTPLLCVSLLSQQRTL